jgi:hypothetical protein
MGIAELRLRENSRTWGSYNGKKTAHDNSSSGRNTEGVAVRRINGRNSGDNTGR